MAAIICVMSFWEELMDEVYGKFRRVKYLSMLANIRQAAMENRSINTGGMNTPRSIYAHSVASNLHMAPSQMSIGRKEKGILWHFCFWLKCNYAKIRYET